MKIYLAYFHTFDKKIKTLEYTATSDKEAVCYFIDYAREHYLHYLSCDTLGAA